MSELKELFGDSSFVSGYLENGPPAFMPGHAGVLQMAAVLLREHAPADGQVLVAGAGGGLETRAIALLGPRLRFVGFDPAAEMLALARDVIGPELTERVELIDNTFIGGNGEYPTLELDPFEGGHFVSVVGFLFEDTRVLGVPVPGHRHFEEINLRFYVRRREADGWRRGVAFVKEIVPRPAIATVALYASHGYSCGSIVPSITAMRIASSSGATGLISSTQPQSPSSS